MTTELIHFKIEMFHSENTQVETMRFLLREKQITGDERLKELKGSWKVIHSYRRVL